MSLSARRAWIEINDITADKAEAIVALRKESVDRNQCITQGGAVGGGSLSARRAWIEIAGEERHRSGQESLSARRAWIEI